MLGFFLVYEDNWIDMFFWFVIEFCVEFVLLLLYIMEGWLNIVKLYKIIYFIYYILELKWEFN